MVFQHLHYGTLMPRGASTPSVHARQLAVEPGVRLLRRYHRSLLLRMEQTRRSALENHVHRPPPMGPRVLISESWYKVPLLLPTGNTQQEHLLAGNFNSTVFDFVARQKIQGQTLNLFILEQLPIVPPGAYARTFGPKSAAEIVREAVLELTYTAHDLAPFARDMGHVDLTGKVLPPFAWAEDRRLMLRAKLDAIYFILYGVYDSSNVAQGRDDIRYIYSTFPIIEREETARLGSYRSRELCLAWVNALMAGQPDVHMEAH